MFVSSYPKCGTTWTQYIVYLLCNDGWPLPAGQKLDEALPHLEEVGEERVRQRTPASAHARYLYVVRNPFDCAVPFYHHTRGFVRHYDFVDGIWDTFFECFMRGEVDFGDYFDHLKSWWPHRGDANVLLLVYEEMLAAPSAAVAAIARFVGDWRSTFTPEQCARLAAKFRERTAGMGLEQLWPDLAASALK